MTLRPGNGQFTASWDPPADSGGAAAAGYSVRYRERRKEWNEPIDAGSNNSYTVTRLTNGAQYIVRVRARNAAGESAWTRPKTTTPQAHLNNAAPPPPLDGNAPRESNLQPVPALPAWALGALVALLFGRALRLRRR